MIISVKNRMAKPQLLTVGHQAFSIYRHILNELAQLLQRVPCLRCYLIIFFSTLIFDARLSTRELY
jgi:hypothetical protein